VTEPMAGAAASAGSWAYPDAPPAGRSEDQVTPLARPNPIPALSTTTSDGPDPQPSSPTWTADATKRAPAPAGRPQSNDILIRLDDRVAGLGAQMSSALELLDATVHRVAELARLRTRDSDLIDRLHSDNCVLRGGEVAAATAPLVMGMLTVHDQMVRLVGVDPNSDARLLDTQLMQTIELAGVRSFTSEVGEPFDTARHSGVGRVPTSEPAKDGMIARVVREGFQRADGSVVRVAEVEVNRLTR